MRLGIDFGTTRTVVSLCDDGNHPVVQFEDSERDLHGGFPSVIAASGDELCFGLEAVERLGDPAWTVLPSFKRLFSGAAESISLGGHTRLPADLLAGYLRALRSALLTGSTLSEHCVDDEVIEVIIATPAYASSSQRFTTMEAFRHAGFEVIGLMSEPAAAGVEYASRYQRTFNSRRQTVLIYDLGGGTFDASVVSMTGDAHDVTATAGLPRVGGDDFDSVLVALALAAVGLATDSLSASERTRLRLHCRDQKEQLHSNSRRITVELGGIAGLPEDAYATIPVVDFYAGCQPLIDKTLAVLQPLLSGGEDALAGIAGVYVVGGASALPAVSRALKSAFGRRVHRALAPAAATAVGLAHAFTTVAAFSEPLSRSFGVFRESESGRAVRFDLIFDASQKIPASGHVQQVRTYRPAHNIGHFRYIECTGMDDGNVPGGDISPLADIRFPYDASLRGNDAALEGVSVQRLDEKLPVFEERYTIDASGIIEFSITDLESGFSHQHRFAPQA
jgi:molecular chaperone DnaK (HSP70)